MQAGSDDTTGSGDMAVLTSMWEQLERDCPDLARSLSGRPPWRTRLRRMALSALEHCGRAYSAHHVVAFC